MEKNFDKWNEKKKYVHDRARPFFHTREIWWCSLGVNVGSEQDGSGREYTRPVIILKGLSKETCFIVPLTTSTKEHSLRPPVGVVDGKAAHALLSQMRLIDAKRLVRRIGYLDRVMFEELRKVIKEVL